MDIGRWSRTYVPARFFSLRGIQFYRPWDRYYNFRANWFCNISVCLQHQTGCSCDTFRAQLSVWGICKPETETGRQEPRARALSFVSGDTYVLLWTAPPPDGLGHDGQG